MNIASRLNKPEYLYKPAQLLNAIRFIRCAHDSEVIVRLPWGLRLTINPRETLGRAVMRLGVYDLSVTEAIYRLLILVRTPSTLERILAI